jgi:hypothetical protein
MNDDEDVDVVWWILTREFNRPDVGRGSPSDMRVLPLTPGRCATWAGPATAALVVAVLAWRITRGARAARR